MDVRRIRVAIGDLATRATASGHADAAGFERSRPVCHSRSKAQPVGDCLSGQIADSLPTPASILPTRALLHDPRHTRIRPTRKFAHDHRAEDQLSFFGHADRPTARALA